MWLDNVSPKAFNWPLFTVVVAVSAVLTVISMNNRIQYLDHLSHKDIVALYANVFTHFVLVNGGNVIVFLLPAAYDKFLAIMILLQIVSYMTSESKCVFTENEKRIMGQHFNPSDKQDEPYTYYLHAHKSFFMYTLFADAVLRPAYTFIIFTRVVFGLSSNMVLAATIGAMVATLQLYLSRNFIKHKLRKCFE
jgi:hypothetical protein